MAAIYQRARPTTFDDVIGQEHVKEVLAASVRADRIGHAYLFSGPRGVGKTSCARLLAMALNCDRADVAERPCGQCEPCTSIRSDRHPDVTELDAASNNSVEDVRDLREKARLASSRGGSRVWILDEAHMLSKAAANALLKTLEEPPEGLVFVLATTEPERLPPTVLSRCQHFRFRRLSDAEIIDKLQRLVAEAGVEAEAEALELVARTADGGMRDAESLLERLLAPGTPLTREATEAALGLPPRPRLETLATRLAEADLAGAWQEAEGLYRDGFAPRTLAERLALVLRDALYAEVAGTDGFRVALPAGAQRRVLHMLDDELERFTRRDDLYGLEAALLKAFNAVHDAPAAEPAGHGAPTRTAPAATMSRPQPAPAEGRTKAPAETPPAPSTGVTTAAEADPASEDAGNEPSTAPAPGASGADAPARAGDAGGGFSFRDLRARAGVQLKAFLQPAEHELDGQRLVLRYDERHQFHFDQLQRRRDELDALVREVAGPHWSVEVLGPGENARKKA